MRRRVVIYIFCLILALLISGSTILAPRLIIAGGFWTKWGILTMFTMKGLCHQMPERSYFWNGIQMAVCHRCMGIYAGALIGLLIYPFTPHFRRGVFPSITTFLIFILPVGLDLLVGTLGIWEGHPYIRTITGGMAAIIGVFYIVPGFDEMLTLIFRRKRKEKAPNLPVDR